jgi:hypothetical protein
MSIKVAGTTATRTVGSGITDAQVGAALARFARSLGIPITGVALDDLLAIVDHFVNDVRTRSKQVQVADANAAAQAAIVAQAESDNAL